MRSTSWNRCGSSVKVICSDDAQRDLETDDMAWAKPYVDEARADIARGDVLTLEEHRARNAARLAALRD